PPHNKFNLFVEQASCLLLLGGQDAHPTINLISCGTGILPVQKIINTANINYKTAATVAISNP
ncbi:MAG: hypothetical protein EAZ18_24725, partial [Oscillatoriales cyanobacterium]